VKKAIALLTTAALRASTRNKGTERCVTTTEAKAKAIRGEAEHMITQAKRGLASGDPARVVYLRRLLNGRLNDNEITKKVFDVFAPRYAERPGGYTRVLKLGPRKGDAAAMVLLELVDSDVNKPKGDQTNVATNVASGARGRERRITAGAARPCQSTAPSSLMMGAATRASNARLKGNLRFRRKSSGRCTG
jgi:large subunit ribosomal protein L17